MSDSAKGSHDGAPRLVSDDEEDEKVAAEKAVAWLKAILRQTDARMITAESLERALQDAPEAEVYNILQNKVRMLVANLGNFESGAERVKNVDEAIDVYLAFVEASTAMTPQEFKAVEYLHHELIHYFAQLEMYKPKNGLDDLTYTHITWVKRKFTDAQPDFASAKENVAENDEINAIEMMGGKQEEVESRQLTEEEAEQVELYKRDLGHAFRGQPIMEGEMTIEEMMVELKKMGQEQIILQKLQDEVEELGSLWTGELVDQTHHDVRYWHECLVRQEATFKALTHLSSEEKVVIDSWIKKATEVKAALEERMAVFAADPEIQLMDKMDELTSAVDKALYEPETSSLAELVKGIQGLHEMGREDIVVNFFKDDIEDLGYSVYKDSTVEEQKKWLQRAVILKSWLPSLREIATPDELVTLGKYERALLLKEERVQQMLIETEGKLIGKESVEEAHGQLLGVLGKHAERLEKDELTTEHENKLAKNQAPNEAFVREEEVQKLEGRLYLYLAQVGIPSVGDVIGLGKTIRALNALGRGDVVMAEIIRRRKQDYSYFPERSAEQLKALHLLAAELTPEQLDEVDKWDEIIKEAVEKAKQPYKSTEKELEEHRKEQERVKNEMLDKWAKALYDENALVYKGQLEAKHDKLLGIVKNPKKPIVKTLENKEKELSEEERREIVKTQLNLGSFGYAEQLMAKWWPDKERWFTDPELRQAAQEGIQKQWKEKPLMRPILEKFIKKFGLYTPVEPKVVKKSKKNI